MVGGQVHIVDAVDVDVAQARRAAVVLIGVGLGILGDHTPVVGASEQHHVEAGIARVIAQALGPGTRPSTAPRRTCTQWSDTI